MGEASNVPKASSTAPLDILQNTSSNKSLHCTTQLHMISFFNKNEKQKRIDLENTVDYIMKFINPHPVSNLAHTV